MNVLLVNPPRFNGIPVIREDRCENSDRDCIHPPTSLVYIGGVLKSEGYTVKLFDMNTNNSSWSALENYMNRIEPDWIIFRSTPSTFYEDIKVVEVAKKVSHNPVRKGLYHTLMLCWNLRAIPERVMKECKDLDVFLNEYHYEYAIPKIIENFPSYSHSIYTKVNDISPPAWDLVLDFHKFYTRTKWLSPWAVVRGSKGCPYRCGMCVDANTGWFPRKPELIVNELEYLVKDRNVKYISFFDNTFEINSDWCLAIADEIMRRNLKFKWFINSRADLICKHGLDFFKTLRKAGCNGSSIGIEFGTDEMLRASGKGISVKQGKEAIRILKQAGIKQYISTMMGYLGENKEQILKTRDFIIETKPTGFQLNTVVPFSGTQLMYDAERLNLAGEKIDWRGLSCVPTDTIPVKLSNLETNELISLRKKIYRQIYTSGWFWNNLFGIRSFDDFRLGIGYALSSANRLKKGMNYSH